MFSASLFKTRLFVAAITVCLCRMLSAQEAEAPPAAEPPSLDTEVEQYVDSLWKSAVDGSRQRLLAHVDVNRFIEECLPPDVFKFNTIQRFIVNRAMRTELAESMKFLFVDTKRAEVRRMEIDEDRQLATVLVRIASEDDVLSYIRFYLAKRDGKWRWYDLEDLDLGVRTSVIVGQVVREAAAMQAPPGAMNLRWIDQFRTAAAELDLDRAKAIIEKAEAGRYPPTVEAILLMFKSTLQMQEGETQAALDTVDRALHLRPDFPALHSIRASLLLEAGKHELAIAAAKRYMEGVGPDPDAFLIMGSALKQLGRNEEALEAHRSALNDYPDSLENLLELAGLLPNDNKQELVQRFLAIEDHAEQFEGAAVLLHEKADAASLKALALAWREQAADDPNGIYYLAKAYMLENNYAAAAEILPPSFPMVSDAEERRYYLHLYRTVMLELNKLEEAYQQMPDKQEALEIIVEPLLYDDRYEEVLRVIALHREKFPQDPHALYYEGDVYYYQDQFEKADQVYAQAEQLNPDDELREQILSSRIACFYHLDKPLEAYDKFEPKDFVFTDLVDFLAGDQKVGELKELVQRHEAHVGSTDEIKHWHIRIRWLDKDYDGALELLNQHQHLAEDYEIFDIWVRSLVRSNRLDEAQELIESDTNDNATTMHQLILFAAQANVQRAGELSDEMMSEYWGAAELLEDEDLQRALSTEPFQPLRAKLEQKAKEEREEAEAESQPEAETPEAEAPEAEAPEAETGTADPEGDAGAAE